MAGRHASEIGAWDNGALYTAAQPIMANYLSNAGYDTVMSGKMHFIGPGQLHGFKRRLTTDIDSSDLNSVKQEWIDIKKNQGHDYDEVMSNRQAYNAKGYTGEGVHIGQWHNALSYDEETHFRSLEYLRARGNKPDPLCWSPPTTTRTRRLACPVAWRAKASTSTTIYTATISNSSTSKSTRANGSIWPPTRRIAK
mgnify:FL=1